MSLKGKTAFITGATSGFGMAIARQMAAQGARLIICGRRTERLAALAKELGGDVHTITLDVRDHEAVKQAVKSLPAAFAKVDILVNNAGLALSFGSFEQQDMAHFEQMVDTNIKGVIYCTHAILPAMVAQDSGHIVNIGSVAGNYPYPGGNVYGGTKSFLKQFSLNLRADLLSREIRVTNIEPGMAETEFSLVRFEGDAQKAGAVYAGIEALAASDVADAVLWAITRPAHVNINSIELMPTQQAFAPFAVHRKA